MGVADAALDAYRALGNRLLPLVAIYLRRRVASGKEDATRIAERRGIPSLERPAGPLVWVHAASVGETNAVLPLIERLAGHGFFVLLTTGTRTSAEIAARRLGGNAAHQYAPLDIGIFVDRFLDHWRPGVALFVESELWPAAILALKAKKVPLALVNGRLSNSSFRRWRRAAPVARALLSRLDLCLAQSEADATRFAALGAEPVVVCNNLKFDAAPPQVDEAALKQLAARIGDRPVIVAASTHPGEEELVAAVLADAHAADPLVIVVPRHPERGARIARDVASRGRVVALRSRSEPIAASTQIYVADTIGEMGLWYSLATVAFLGGSLVGHGGQNPIEPAHFMTPIVHGPDVGNFAAIYRSLADAEGAIAVADGAALPGALRALLDDPDKRRMVAQRAARCIRQFVGGLECTITALQPLLAKIRPSPAGARHSDVQRA